MPSRILRSSVAGAAVRALALAAAAAVGSAAEAGGAAGGWVVAQLGPTSPGFKMNVHRGETGAPESTAVGGVPTDRRPSGSDGAEWRAKATHPSSEKEDQEKAAAGKSDERNAGEPKPAAAGADSGGTTQAAKAGKAGKPGSASGGSAMDVLREKLAAKLGATPAAGGKYAMQVSNRGESGENTITAVRPSATAIAIAAAHRAKPAAPAGADGDADPPIATRGGKSLLPTPWDYAGAGGPESWGRLRADYGKCSTGSRQSPIDIRGGIAVDLEPIRFDYHASSFSVLDEGHTVQVDVEPGNAITITGRRYELVQFHFHRPSEERVDGRQYDMVAHLVHKDAQGRLAVVAVLLDRGSAQAVVQAVWNNLPLEKGDEVHASTRIDLSQLLPEDRRYYTYMGSLTTPPCSEGVLWMVMKQPVPISADQIAIFSRLYPMNARPIQQADGRLIKQSN